MKNIIRYEGQHIFFEQNLQIIRGYEGGDGAGCDYVYDDTGDGGNNGICCICDAGDGDIQFCSIYGSGGISDVGGDDVDISDTSDGDAGSIGDFGNDV